MLDRKPKPAACEACGASDDIKRFPILGFASCRDRDACLERVRAKDAPAVEPEQPTCPCGCGQPLRREHSPGCNCNCCELVRAADEAIAETREPFVNPAEQHTTTCPRCGGEVPDAHGLGGTCVCRLRAAQSKTTNTTHRDLAPSGFRHGSRDNRIWTEGAATERHRIRAAALALPVLHQPAERLVSLDDLLYAIGGDDV